MAATTSSTCFLFSAWLCQEASCVNTFPTDLLPGALSLALEGPASDAAELLASAAEDIRSTLNRWGALGRLGAKMATEG
eukprot:11227270-Lingulodinium_polyedra.AAC.1